MNDRLTTLGGIALVLIFLAGIFYQGEQVATLPHPTSIEPSDDGYLGLARWLDASGVPIESLQQKLTDIDLVTATDVGNILILTIPFKTPMD